jgi:hypothetical protein
MKMRRSLFTILSVSFTALLISCVQKSTNNEQPKEDVVVEDSTQVEPPIDPIDTLPTTPPTVDIKVYSEYPEAIDGCACYFGLTSPELSEGNYVFMTNYEKKAYMILDGKMRTFELVQSENLPSGELKETWQHADYDMVVQSKETGEIDETWQSIGTISIQPKDKEKTVIRVVGECGC